MSLAPDYAFEISPMKVTTIDFYLLRWQHPLWNWSSVRPFFPSKKILLFLFLASSSSSSTLACVIASLAAVLLWRSRYCYCSSNVCIQVPLTSRESDRYKKSKERTRVKQNSEIFASKYVKYFRTKTKNETLILFRWVTSSTNCRTMIV